MIRFLVFGDVHYDHLPDGSRRVQELMEVIREEKTEFCTFIGRSLQSDPTESLGAKCVGIGGMSGVLCAGQL